MLASVLRRHPLLALVLLGFLLFVQGGGTQAATESGQASFVRLHTEVGDILLALDSEVAPHHVQNFLHLASTGFYDGTYFHRIIPGFMIQGGDPNTKDESPGNDGQGGPGWQDVLPPAELARLREVEAMVEKRGYVLPDRAQLAAEFSATPHVRGTLSMARANDPDSGGSQFFICVARAPHLDNQYTAFGHVVSGMDVVDQIVSAPQRPGRGNQPVDPVHILSATVIEDTSQLTAAERDSLAAE
jgi:cyclophilin family peptidyl-prolyl cis-trans isomerase